MAPTVPLTQLDQIAMLLIAGRNHRDSWLPLLGTRKSGFSHPEGTLDPERLAVLIADQSQLEEVRPEIQELLSDREVRVIPASSTDYPRRLRDLDGRPALLFVRGDLGKPSTTALAIVGSRDASQVGVEAARMVAERAAAAGHTIVSGLAAGIDSASHRGALDGGGRTIAVMGTGLGEVYPSRNRGLADRIARQGALLTQFPPMHPPTKTTFPARNVLIAGLSDVSLVVEMKEHSGTRIEVNCAIMQGRRVLLWAPILESQAWARRLAEQPHVEFVKTHDDVLAELSATK
jgi:DNA processing protein